MSEAIKKDVEQTTVTSTQSTEVKEHHNRQAQEIKRLMDEGKTLVEALTLTQHLIPNNRVIGNRVEYIKGLQSLAEVKTAQHGAHAKLSKAKQAGNKEAQARYLEEIATAKDRYNELMAEVSKSSNPLQKALELGERPSGLVQMIITKEEAKVNKQLEQVKEALKWTNKNLKSQVNSQIINTPKQLQEQLLKVSPDLLDLYEGRKENGDQRVLTLNRRMNLIAKLEDEARKAEDAKATQKTEVVEDTQKTEVVKEPQKTETAKDTQKTVVEKPKTNK